MKKTLLHYLALLFIGMFCAMGPARVNAQITITTNFTNNNNNYGITFNFQNTNPYPVTITNIGTIYASGSQDAEAWYNTNAVNGYPSNITVANGWTEFASGTATAGDDVDITSFLSGFTLTIPANTTYGIYVGSNSGLIYYSTIAPGTYTFPGGGCNLITGDNIGYGGTYPPAAPDFYPRGFIGSITVLSNPCAGTPTAGNITTPIITTPICGGDSVMIVATDPNQPVSGITYQWQSGPSNAGPWTDVTGGTGYNSLSYTTLPLAATTWFRLNITCTNGNATTSTDAFEVPVNPIVTPDVTIDAAPNDSICAGTSVTFTATTTNGGLAPTYQWQKNNTNVGTGITYTDAALVNSDVISCILTSNAACATQLTDTANDVIAVFALPVPVITANGTVLSAGTYVTYQWYRNNSMIGGATNATYTATQNGSYTVKVTDQHGCTGTSSVQTVTGVGVANIYGNSEISLYPNPNEGNFTISGNISTVSNFATIQIMNVIGQVLYNTTIPVNNYNVNREILIDKKLPAGTYTLRVSADGYLNNLPFTIK